MRKRSLLVLVGCIFLLSLSSCSTLRGWFGKDARPVEATQQAADSVAADSQDTAEAKLKAMVTDYIGDQERKGSKSNPALVRKRPYYYREFVQYPKGAELFDVTIRENDSRTRPLYAEVKMDKIRFSTQMHRDRGNAESDNNFLRDTGKETLNYELRNGRWRRVGSLFVADKTEEFINGEWAPRREETTRVNPSENKPGFFRRMWSKISGADTE